MSTEQPRFTIPDQPFQVIKEGSHAGQVGFVIQREAPPPDTPPLDAPPPEPSTTPETAEDWAELIRTQGRGFLSGQFPRAWLDHQSGGEDLDEENFNSQGFINIETPPAQTDTMAIRNYLHSFPSTGDRKVNFLIASDYFASIKGTPYSQALKLPEGEIFREINYIAWRHRDLPGSRRHSNYFSCHLFLPEAQATDLIRQVEEKPDLIEGVFQQLYPDLTGDNQDHLQRIQVEGLKIFQLPDEEYSAAEAARQLQESEVLPFSQPVGELPLEQEESPPAEHEPTLASPVIEETQPKIALPEDWGDLKEVKVYVAKCFDQSQPADIPLDQAGNTLQSMIKLPALARWENISVKKNTELPANIFDLPQDHVEIVMLGEIAAPLGKGGSFQLLLAPSDEGILFPQAVITQNKNIRRRITQQLFDREGDQSGTKLTNLLSEKLGKKVNHLELKGDSIRLVAAPKEESSKKE
jgi:hypothetical protein